MKKPFIQALQLWDKWLQTQFEFPDHVAQIASFVNYEKWVERQKNIQTTHT